jgi:predicted ArsR family transcriptional regulator
MTPPTGNTSLFEYAERYPQIPGFKSRDTAEAAARSISSRAPRLRQLCLDQLMLFGPMSADECAANMRVDRLSIRPRFSELAAAGKIRDSGQRHKNASGRGAVVWSLVR